MLCVSGEVSPTTAAQALVQALMLQPAALNASLSIIGTPAPAPSQLQWDDQFLRLDGPELWRQVCVCVCVRGGGVLLPTIFLPTN